MSRAPVASIPVPTPTAVAADALIPTAGRYHSLDALRASALILGVFLHAAVSYIPGPGIVWAAQDRSTHWLFGVAVFVVHSFRLEVFFLLAGFLAHLMHERRGLGGFAGNRLMRVLVPLAVGWLAFLPWVSFAWIWGKANGEPGAMVTALGQGYGFALLTLGSVVNLKFLNSGFPLMHLWFLYYLRLVYGCFFAARGAGYGLLRHSRQRERARKWLCTIIESRWSVLALAAATWAILGLMKGWDVDTPDKSLFPHVGALLLFGLFFSLGWMARAQTALLDAFRRRRWYYLALGAALMLPLLWLSSFQAHSNEPVLQLIRAVYRAGYALMMWCWALGFTGLFLHFFERPSRFWRYLSDSSYWVYIVHLPLVALLQVALSPYPHGCWIKFAIVSGATMVFSLVTYHLLVRSTFVGRILNGRRYPFSLWRPSTP